MVKWLILQLCIINVFISISNNVNLVLLANILIISVVFHVLVVKFFVARQDVWLLRCQLVTVS